MNISARSHLTAGVSLTAAATIAFAPVAVPHPIPAAPPVAAPPVALTANPAIGVVDTIVSTLDTVFTRLSDATSDPTAAASLEILRGLSVRAFAMLAENLRRGDAVNAATTAQVADLLTTALSGPPTGGVAGTRMLVGLGLDAIQAVGDAGFALAGIALDEVTFQFNNGIGGLSALLTQLGDASGSPVVEAVVKVVQGLTFTPALAVFNAGSQIAGSVLGAAHAGFDAVLDGAGAAVRAAPEERVAVATSEDEAPRVETTALRDEKPAEEPAAERADDSESVDDDPVAEQAVTDVAADETADEPADVTTDEPTAEPKSEPKNEPKEAANQQETTTDTAASTPVTDAAA